MREIRMTFGEHLEDLRRRLIFCLLYLLVGLTISMIYGKELMEWTLGPHYRAIRAAQRDRLIGRMEKMLRRTEYLTSARPVGSLGDERPLLDSPPLPQDWAVTFAGEVALPQISQRIEEPFKAFARDFTGTIPGLEEVVRAKLCESVLALGKAVSRALAEEFAPGFAASALATIPERFRRLEQRLREAVERGVGPSDAQKLIGWGRSLDGVLATLQAFNRFLQARKEQVIAARLPLDQLHSWAAESKLPEALNEVLLALEADAISLRDEKPIPLMVINYLESFMAYLKVSMIFGIFLTLPFMLYEMWKFVGAGLYHNEQKYIVTILPFSLLLFVVGSLFGYFAMIPVGLQFLAGWGIEDVNLSFTLESYIGLFFTLTLILGLVFQTPLLMIFLTKIGIIEVKWYRKVRRMAYFIGICLAVILTPPDPFSWALMAIPMIFLYEVGIWLCGFFEKKKPALESPVA